MGDFELPGVSGLMSETPGNAGMPAPDMGQHNEEIFVGLLGVPRETVQRLIDEKVLY